MSFKILVEYLRYFFFQIRNRYGIIFLISMEKKNLIQRINMPEVGNVRCIKLFHLYQFDNLCFTILSPYNHFYKYNLVLIKKHYCKKTTRFCCHSTFFFYH